jgi:hypothetical protein
MRTEYFHFEEKTNFFGVQYRLCQSCCIRTDFIKDRGYLLIPNFVFMVILIMYFFRGK